MDWYTTIKDFYDSGYYDKDKVKVFVTKNKITQAQYAEITGEPFGGE